MVGQAHAARLLELGHEVVMGANEFSKTKHDPAFASWLAEHNVPLLSFKEALAQGDVVIEALKGTVALDILAELEEYVRGKTLIDIANPLDFSTGELRLMVVNTDSLGEQIQIALPETNVVKMFNTITAAVQVQPDLVTAGEQSLLYAGNNAKAKKVAADIARAYGWKDCIDLGDITAARGMEMMLPVWLRLNGALNTGVFGYKIIR